MLVHLKENRDDEVLCHGEECERADVIAFWEMLEKLNRKSHILRRERSLKQKLGVQTASISYTRDKITTDFSGWCGRRI